MLPRQKFQCIRWEAALGTSLLHRGTERCPVLGTWCRLCGSSCDPAGARSTAVLPAAPPLSAQLVFQSHLWELVLVLPQGHFLCKPHRNVKNKTNADTKLTIKPFDIPLTREKMQMAQEGGKMPLVKVCPLLTTYRPQNVYFQLCSSSQRASSALQPQPALL